MNQFMREVLDGLKSQPKRLDSKFFYDGDGDKLFQEIMNCPEYYLTRCELEIFSGQAAGFAELFINRFNDFDLVELGPGDVLKSSYLFKELLNRKTNFNYYPIDISSGVITQLENELPERLPGIVVNGLNGEYFRMLEKLNTISSRNKVVLFLGSNIGNIEAAKSREFCRALRNHLSLHDLLLVGFDLKKNPHTVLAAYNDKGGITKKFNLNLLKRINIELGGDFNLEQFDHYPVYDPVSGACKSYLISLSNQRVCLADIECFDLAANEPIHVEVSQKYSIQQTDDLALSSGFKPIQHFYDSKKWFLDTVWECI